MVNKSWNSGAIKLAFSPPKLLAVVKVQLEAGSESQANFSSTWDASSVGAAGLIRTGTGPLDKL